MTEVQLDRPGVEVLQEFVATTPTILRPSLAACIVGPCKQVVEAVLDDGSFNAGSLLSVPARLTTPWVSTPFQYTGVGGKNLVLSINNAPPQPIALPGTDPTAAQIADAIRTAAISGLSARVETSGTQQRVVLETAMSGDNAALSVASATPSAVLTGLGLAGGQASNGASGYNNAYELRIQISDYPNPRSNLADLKVDYSSVRVFVNPGNGRPYEVLRSEGILRGARSQVTVADDGDGDSLSPYLDFAGADFHAGATRARLEGNADITALNFANQVQGKVLRISLNGGPLQTLVVPNTVTDAAGLTAALNGLLGTGVASVNATHLVLTIPSGFGGTETSVRVDKDNSSADLLTALGLTNAGGPLENTDTVRGGAFAPVVGDEVWVDGLRIGQIVEVPATPVNRLRLDAERLLTYTGASWYVVAKGLDNNASSATRPSSNLVIDENTGTITIRAGLFHDTAGMPTHAQGLSTYLAYDALRLDVTPRKADGDFNVLRIGSLTELEEKLAPISTENPLALGMYFALLNSPGLEVMGCGVDTTNDDAPYGTVEAYARAFEFLESKELYNIVPLTHDAEVGQLAAVHVAAMSEPTNGLERATILNPLRPSRRSNTLVASGPRANVAGPPSDVVQTGLANLQALLAAAGKPGPAYTEDDAVFLELEGDANRYLVEGVASGGVTVNNGPLVKNSDGFYLDGGGSPVFNELIVDRPFSVFIRGALVSNHTEEAAAYGDLGRGYKSRRVICTAPDTAKTTLDGLEQMVPGFYMAAGLAGRKAAKNPSQPLTEDSLIGFTGVVGAQERYSEPQLRIMAGGGIWIFYQEADGQPVRTRHQITTDVSTLLTRESSILDALDYAAKTLRTTFRNFIGRYNITTGLMESLNLVADGVRDFLVSNGVFASFNVVAFEQDASEPDAITAIIDVETLKPLNKLRITLRVT